MFADVYDEIDYCVETNYFGCSPNLLISSQSSNTLRKDICVTTTHNLQIWGQLLTQKRLSLYDVLVQLIEITSSNTSYHFKKLSETKTDMSGFYYFLVAVDHIGCYQLIIHSRNPLNNKILGLSLNPCTSPPILVTTIYALAKY